MRVTLLDNSLILCNFDRVDDKLLYKQAKVLLEDAGAMFDQEVIGPSENIYYGVLDGDEIALVLDLNYGAEVRSANTACLSKIEQILRK